MRLQYIEAIRGLAALGVAYFHFVHYLADTKNIAVAGLAAFVIDMPLGTACVMVFFLLSGFVIPPSITSVRTFAIRRFFRLYPTYWLALAFCAIIFQKDDAWTLLVHATMLQAYFAYPEINGVAWTLAVELIFYVLCAGLFTLGLLHNAVVLMLLVLGFGLDSLYQFHPPQITSGLAVMFAGSLLRRITPNGDFRVPQPLPWLGAISYQVYLLHLPLIWCVHRLKGFDAFFIFLARVPAYVQIVAFLALVAGVSWLVHRYVEVPFINLGKFLTRRRDQLRRMDHPHNVLDPL